MLLIVGACRGVSCGDSGLIQSFEIYDGWTIALCFFGRGYGHFLSNAWKGTQTYIALLA